MRECKNFICRIAVIFFMAVIFTLGQNTIAKAEDIYSDNLIPTMTGYTNGEVTISASAHYMPYDEITRPWHAFDRNSTKSWVCNADPLPAEGSHWVEVDFGTPKSISKITITCANEHASVKNFKIQGSNNNSNWQDIYTGINTRYNGVKSEFTFNNYNYYRYYRVLVLDSYSYYGKTYCGIDELEMMEEKVPTSISLNKSVDNLQVGQTDILTATTMPTSTAVNWSSSDSSIATIDSNGKITGIKAGTVIITATAAESGKTATCTVNVTNPVIPGIRLNKTSDSLTIGQTDNLVATTTPSGAQVTWTTSDSSIATVDSNGKITGIKEGQATITATTVDGLTATCIVNVINTTGPTEAEYIINTARAKGDNTNNASGEVSIIFKGIAEAQLSVVKTADVDSVYVGDNFTYTIVVTNTSTKIAKAVVINDSAPNHIDFTVSGVTTTQGNVDPSSTSKNIIVNVGDIAPLGTVTIKIPATVIL